VYKIQSPAWNGDFQDLSEQEEKGQKVETRLPQRMYDMLEQVRAYTGVPISSLVKGWIEDGLDHYFTRPAFRTWRSDEKQRRKTGNKGFTD
jgi:predicted DNA-binding protein